ncbi:MAG: dihydrofolate reductase family protein [Bdellovibrionales bacterium]
MKVLLFMAMSLNGLIADEQGKEDFLSNVNWACFCELAQEKGGFVIGRKTYEIVSHFYEGFGFDDLSGVKIIVSSDSKYAAPEGYLHAMSPQDAIKLAEDHGLASLLLTGGALLNSHFLKEELVDEVLINVEPVLIGKGKNLVAPVLEKLRMRLVECSPLSRGVVQLRYAMD